MQSHETSRNKSGSLHFTLGQRSHSRRQHTANTTDDPAFKTRSMAAASISTRSADLSGCVNRVEEGIYEIKDQLKEIFGPRRQHTVTSTPRSRREPLQGPQQYLDFERELRRADPPFDTQKGKDTVRDFFVSNPIPRPYMLLQGPGFHSPKDKVPHRDKMTFNQYILAFTCMLKDKRACTQDEWPEIITHMNQVACNAQSRPWENVRAWSDHIFTRIENGDITWSSYAEIQFDRMRLSLAPAGDHTAKQTTDIQAAKQVVCSDFINFMHVCAWCHTALNSRNPHTVIKSENKMRFAQDRQQQPHQQTQPAQIRHNNYQTQPQQTQNYGYTQQQPQRQVFTSAIIQNPQPTQKPKNDQ